MVIKGSARGGSAADVRRLADHLLDADNEEVSVIGITGTTATDLHQALAEMRAVSLGTRTRRSLYHASINVARDEAAAMTPARWQESVEELEQRLGLVGHARAMVLHRKRGREHVHVVWSRVHPLTLRTASDANNYLRHEQCARALEERFGLRAVIGAHTRPPGTPRPKASATHGDWQASERTGLPVEDVAARIRGAWQESPTGTAFAAALEARGLSLATGRRGLLVVDDAGTPHSIARRLGLPAAQVRAKLADLDPSAFPALNEQKQQRKGGNMKRNIISGIAACSPAPDTDWEALEEYWRGLGFEPVRKWDCLYVDAYGGTIRDYGNRMEIVTDGPPSDEQIMAIIAAAQARNWQGIRFYGGADSEWQHRAKVLAIKAGFDPGSITLECEEGQPKELASSPMPDHLRNRLGLPEPARPTPPEDTPAPAQQPKYGR